MKSRTLAHKLCAECRQHRALFRYRGRVRADHFHTLCFRCYRSAADRLTAAILLSNNEEKS